MSSDETQSPLARAYDLVEAGDLEEARALLESILDADSENADAWWIYAHAVTDPEAGRNALENVLSIDPNYPGAAELLAQAEEMSPSKPKITPIAPVTMPETPAALPEDEFPEPEVAAPAAPKVAPRKPTKAPPAPQRRSTFPIFAVVTIIIVALVLLVLLLQTGGTPLATATPTQVVEAIMTPTEAVAAVTEEPTQISPTAEATEPMPTLAPTTTSEQATSEAVGVDYAAIEAALSEFPLAESGIGIVDTSLGSTLLVTVCTTQGRAMRTLLPQVMNALAGQSPPLGSDVAAVGTRMLDCTENAAFITVATDMASAQSYASGGLSDSEFAATWKPQ